MEVRDPDRLLVEDLAGGREEVVGTLYCCPSPNLATESKSVSPTDDSLLKMLYLAMIDITKKWTGRRQDWSRIHAQLSIYFAERMPD